MHVEAMTVNANASKLLGKVYSMCAFMKSGSHWFRLCRSIGQWAHRIDHRQVLAGRPSATSRQLARSIVAYIRDAGMPIEQRSSARRQRWKHGLGKDPTAKTHAARQAHEANVSALRQHLEETYNALDDREAVHYCNGPACCPDGVASLRMRLKATGSLFLSRIPSPPAASKWTKLVPALTAIVPGILLRVWPRLLPIAFEYVFKAVDESAPSKYLLAKDLVDEDDKNADGRQIDQNALSGKIYKKCC